MQSDHPGYYKHERNGASLNRGRHRKSGYTPPPSGKNRKQRKLEERRPKSTDIPA